MKNIINTSKRWMLTVLVFAFIMSCNKEKVEPETSVATDLATGAWSLVSVMHEDQGDLTDYYSGFTITFVEEDRQDSYNGSYTVTNGGIIFAQPGQWEIVEGSTGHTLNLSNGLMISSVLLDDSLTLTFTYSDATGRTNGLGGSYVFSLMRS